jgi:hypothetical protein
MPSVWGFSWALSYDQSVSIKHSLLLLPLRRREGPGLKEDVLSSSCLLPSPVSITSVKVFSLAAPVDSSLVTPAQHTGQAPLQMLVLQPHGSFLPDSIIE